MAPPAFAAVPAAFRLNPTPVLGVPRIEPGRAADTIEEEETDALSDRVRTGEVPRLAMPPSPPNLDVLRATAPDLGALRPPLDSNERITVPDSAGAVPPPTSRRAPRSPSPAGEVPPPTSACARPARSATPTSLWAAPAGRLRSPRSRAPEALQALAVVAEKALVLGRAEEAERVLQKSLLELLDAVRRGEVDVQAAELAASLGAKLAHALGAGRWFDYAVAMYAVRTDVMPAPVVDLLLLAVRKAKPIDKQAFRKYLAAARSSAGDSPARRFAVQRLEGVQRLLDLK